MAETPGGKSPAKKRASGTAKKSDTKKTATGSSGPAERRRQESARKSQAEGRGRRNQEKTASTVGSTLEGLGALFGGVMDLSGAALQYAAERTIDQASRIINTTPEQMERMGVAGRSLKDLRQVTGISLDELARAIDTRDTDLLSAIEEGRAALPFEILLRLASFYARNNPLPFVLKYARTYNPRISEMLEKVGVDKLVIEAEREMQVVQIYRSRDAARQLSDEAFEKVRAFTEHAFDMALHFAADEENISLDEHAREYMNEPPRKK